MLHDLRFGIVKVQYQRDMRTDPIIKQRIEDSQEHPQHRGPARSIEGDEAQRCDLRPRSASSSRPSSACRPSKEVVAAEELVIDRVRHRPAVGGSSD